MFGTEMQPTTFVIIIIQFLILFAQCIFYILRPEKKSRLRLLILIVAYIAHSITAGLFPDENIPIPIFIQNTVTYGIGLLLGVYFLCYVYSDFQIQNYKYYGSKSLLYSIGTAFVLLFFIPYVIFKNFELSKILYLSVAIIIASIFLYKTTKELLRIYRQALIKKCKLFRNKVIANCLALITLFLMPVITSFGDYQVLEQSVVNFGFLIIMTTYIIELITQSHREAMIIKEFERKNKTASQDLQISHELKRSILAKLQNFENNHDFLCKKITRNSLAKEFETNTKYLAVIIKSNKGKYFTQYINELRIEYAKNRIENDSVFRNYKIQSMANELGFTAVASFKKAFFKKEQIEFSDYLKKIRDEN